MTDEQALLNAIEASPRDITPRLVYAEAIYVTENPNATYNDERISRIVFTPDAELVWQPEGYEAVRATNPKLAAQILANSERVKAGMKPFPLEEIENLIQDVNYLKHYLGHLYANLEDLEES